MLIIGDKLSFNHLCQEGKRDRFRSGLARLRRENFTIAVKAIIEDQQIYV